MRDPSRFTLTASIALHALFVVGLLALPAGVARHKKHEPLDLVFYQPAPAPPVPVLAVPPQPVAAPAPRKAAVPRPVPRPKPAPPQVAVARPAPPPAPVPVETPRRPAEPPPQPVVAQREAPRPQVHTGMLEPTRPTPAVVRKTDPAVPQIGSFKVAVAETPPARQDVRVAAPVGFGARNAAAPQDGATPARHAEVTHTAFAAHGGTAVDAARPRGTSAAVSRGSFGPAAGVALPASQQRQAVEVADTPVEIVSKPKPRYTDAARQLRVEGEVLLEVTFVATGDLRVLRVLDGLGHGLDEAAVEAARKIQFKPARRNGQSVDHTATLRVVFRLA